MCLGVGKSGSPPWSLTTPSIRAACEMTLAWSGVFIALSRFSMNLSLIVVHLFVSEPDKIIVVMVESRSMSEILDNEQDEEGHCRGSMVFINVNYFNSSEKHAQIDFFRVTRLSDIAEICPTRVNPSESSDLDSYRGYQRSSSRL
jgi:hypothetical protein